MTRPDVRWFAPNRYCTLPVERLRAAGLGIAVDGGKPARIALAADGVCAVSAFEYAARHRIPLVLYLWDLPPWWLGQGRPDFVFLAGGRIRKIPRVVGGYRQRAGFLSRCRYVAQRARQVWTPSAATQDDVRAWFQVAAERVPFCYDSDRFRPLPLPERRPDQPPTVLSISRLEPHKNQQLVIRAAAQVQIKVRVRLIGEGPEAPALTRLARERGVDLELVTERLSDDAILAAYREASVVVCPSRFEGFGLTPLEGLAVGRPVLASDIPPHREFAGGADFFDPSDDRALAEGLERVLGRGPSSAGAGALDRVSIECCAERFAARLDDLLRSLG